MSTHTEIPAPLDPERALLGCLLRLPLPEARRLLAGMRADDCTHPASQHALQLIIETVAAGHRPEPVTVFTHAQSTGQITGEHATARFAHWLLDTFHDAPAPPAGDYLKAVVLERAWRRALVEYADRLRQAAESSPTEVARQVADDRAHVDELWHRYQAALDANPPRASYRMEVAA